jgi:hypothetical protein
VAWTSKEVASLSPDFPVTDFDQGAGGDTGALFIAGGDRPSDATTLVARRDVYYLTHSASGADC